MKDVEVYGKLLEEFIRKVTGQEIGQFRLEISTLRIIIERERLRNPVLVKFSLSETGTVINNLSDREESLKALQVILQRSVDFISSLIGEELAKDLIVTTMEEDLNDMVPHLAENLRLLKFVPEPFNSRLKEMVRDYQGATDHDEVLDLFKDIFQSFMKDLSAQTDLSAFKLKLNILREKHDLLKYVEVKKNNVISFDKERWAQADEDEVKEALVDTFNSMVGLSTFLVGKEEAVKRASRSLEYYFEGKEHLLRRYKIRERIIDGAMSRKVPTGLGELDARMRGGIPKGASLLLIAPSGIERDLFISRMMSSGLRNGSSVLMVLSKEPPRSIRMLLRSQGLDPEGLEEEGLLRLVDWFTWRGERIIGVEKDGHALKSSRILSNLGIAINKASRELSFSNSRIGFVHMIGPALNIFDFNQVYNFIQRLRAKFKEEEMATLFLLETELMENEHGKRLLDVFDGQIELTKRLENGNFKREIAVTGLTGSDFDARPIPLEINDNRIFPIGGEKTPSPKLPGGRAGTESPPQAPRREPRRQPDEPLRVSPKDVGNGQEEEVIWSDDLLGESNLDLGNKERTVKGQKVAMIGEEGRPEVIRAPPDASGSDKVSLERPPPRPVVRVSPLRKRIVKVSDAWDPVVPSIGPVPRSSPPPVKARRVRKTIGGGVKARSPTARPNPMEEIDINGTKNSPQKLLLDAIDTIDQLLDGPESAVQSGEPSHKIITKKRQNS